MSLIFIGDIHQNWHHVERGLSVLLDLPKAAVLLGDVECTAPLDLVAAPLLDRGIEVYWIHGNHDYDGGTEMWSNLTDPVSNPRTSPGGLHGLVTEIAGLRIAGLGGTFEPQVWSGDGRPRVHRREDLPAALTASRPDLSSARAAASAHILGATAIWPEDFDTLASQKADVLVTHEAPSSHPAGVHVLDELARAMGAQMIVHGHHHITSQARARDGLRVLSVGDAWAVDADGVVVWRGEKRRRPLPRPGEGWNVEFVPA